MKKILDHTDIIEAIVSQFDLEPHQKVELRHARRRGAPPEFTAVVYDVGEEPEALPGEPGA